MSEGSVRPRVAVLLAAYQGAGHLDDQLSSLFWQNGVDLHVFARDDGSRDETGTILRRHASARPDRVSIVTDDTGSTGSATGNFFSLLRHSDFAGFDYVALADQDDVWMPDKLARAVTQLAAHRADGYSSDLIAYHEGENRSWMLRKAGSPAAHDYLFQGASAGCTYVLTTKAARLVATQLSQLEVPLCPGASHDWIIYAICRSHGLDWVRDPTSRILYRQHANNVYGALPGLGGIGAKARMVRDKWYRAHILWLTHVIANRPDEAEILRAVAVRGISNRIRLARRANELRRTPRDAALLRLALLTGLF